ncbi:RNA processing factor [Lithospermum erythrorhizon]|uniref:RNA processing factor n=1 Tax=Lithospermum erythrorhizon TaxID=34254 RepID=A0AAV3Q3M8_LITER
MNIMNDDEEYSWYDLKQKITNIVKNISPSNIQETTKALFVEDLVLGKSAFCRAILETSIDSPDSIPSLASLVASINARIPDIGFVLIKHIVMELRSAFRPRDIDVLQILSQLLGCLVNFRVVYDVLAVQFLLALLKKNDDEDHIEVAVTFMLECGYTLFKFTPSLLEFVFERLIEIYHSGDTHKSSRQLIESMFIIRRDCFSGFEVQRPELEDQFTHEIPLDYVSDHESLVDVLKVNLENGNICAEKSLKSVLHCEWEVAKSNHLCGWLEDESSMEESVGSCDIGDDDEVCSHSC